MLTPEKRLRVAVACAGHGGWIAHSVTRIYCLDDMAFGDPIYVYWEPSENTVQWKALTRKCAELIEAMDGDNLGTMMLFNKYLATSNTSAIEELVSELLEVAGL
jgi:hypothetical protein